MDNYIVAEESQHLIETVDRSIMNNNYSLMPLYWSVTQDLEIKHTQEVFDYGSILFNIKA